MTEDLPAVIDGAQAAWKEVEQSNLGDRMKRALRHVVGGVAVREAAELEGYNDSRDLYRYCKRFGLIDTRTAAIVNTHRNIAKLAGTEMERRLIEEPDQIKTPALAVIGGISTDKVLAFEKVETDDGTAYLSALERMAERVAESGTTIELKVSIGPTTPGAETIDVTPKGDQ